MVENLMKFRHNLIKYSSRKYPLNLVDEMYLMDIFLKTMHTSRCFPKPWNLQR